MHRDEFGSQLNESSDAVVQDDLSARHHGRVAVCASGDDFSQPRLQTGKRAQSHFSVEALYWPEDHQRAPNRFSVLVEPDNANVADAEGPPPSGTNPEGGEREPLLDHLMNHQLAEHELDETGFSRTSDVPGEAQPPAFQG